MRGVMMKKNQPVYIGAGSPEIDSIEEIDPFVSASLQAQGCGPIGAVMNGAKN